MLIYNKQEDGNMEPFEANFDFTWEKLVWVFIRQTRRKFEWTLVAIKAFALIEWNKMEAPVLQLLDFFQVFEDSTDPLHIDLVVCMQGG